MATLTRYDDRFRWEQFGEESREKFEYRRRRPMPAGPSAASRGYRRSLAQRPSRLRGFRQRCP